MPLTKKTISKTWKPSANQPDIRKFMTKREVATIAKKAVLRIAETKEAVCTNEPGTQLYHNITNRIAGNLIVAYQGVTDTQSATLTSNTSRIGDEIQPVSLTLYFQFRQPADRPNVTFKVFVLKFWGSTPLPTFVPFKQITSNAMIDPVDNEKCSVVMQRTYKLPDNYWAGTLATSKEACFFRKAYIKLPRKPYKYSGDNSVAGKNYNLGLYVVAYDTMGTLVTDNIGTFQYNSFLKFKDI